MTPGISLRSDDDLLEITLDRPARRNALGEAEWSLLETAFREAAETARWDYVVLRGAGAFFCAGVDLALIEQAKRKPAGLVDLVERNGRILQRLETLPQFTIVALNGPAIGIGVHLALCSDFAVAVKDAYFWIPEARLGIADVLHYKLLESRLGRPKALAMSLLGTRLGAAAAAEAGLVGQLVDGEAELSDSVSRAIQSLREVPRPVRREMKRHLLAQPSRSDSARQVEAIRALSNRAFRYP